MVFGQGALSAYFFLRAQACLRDPPLSSLSLPRFVSLLHPPYRKPSNISRDAGSTC
jgi:hypothetical protein